MEGRYAFTAQVAGEHKICLQTNTTRWFGGGVLYDIEVDIETGAGAIDYSEVAKLESLTCTLSRVPTLVYATLISLISPPRK